MIEPIDIDGLIDKIDYNIDKFIKISDSEMELMEKQVDIPWHRFEDESYWSVQERDREIYIKVEGLVEDDYSMRESI